MKYVKAMLIFGIFLCVKVAFAQEPTQADNWCKEAQEALTTEDGRPIACKDVEKRCVKMNNYWCQKHGLSPWRGTPKASGADGNRDIDGHAIFSFAKWSARAIAKDLQSKYNRGNKSALAIMSLYSPWCDTLGSKAVITRNGQEYGRTCKDGRASPPAGFRGQLCRAPTDHTPGVANCKAGCNCPIRAAETLVKSTGKSIHEDLNLFDQDGNATSNLGTVIRNLAMQEQGIYVNPELVKQGISLLKE